MRYFLSILLCLPLLGFDIDRLYDSTLSTIATTLEQTDIYLSDDNRSIKQRFNIATSLEMVTETYQPTLFRFNVRANIELPRTQKKLHLFLQDFEKSNSIDKTYAKNIEDSIQNTSYLFGLQYLTRSNIAYRAGLRFRKVTPDPFLSARWSKTHYFKDSWIYFGDKLYYYVRHKWDNTLFAHYQYKLNDQALFSLENSYRYEKRPNEENQYVHALKLYLSRGRYELLVPRAEIYLHSNNDSSYKLHYYFAGFSYRNVFFRNWLFYEIAPAVLWRIENNFRPSYRLGVSVGITFEKN
ncbi:MAG: hypothetical protein C6H99_04570 [Epsilonproteobacteria bacterium]|nr:hypothetical protein [Campylobacterota bacterium]NPA63641.1 hypothetical protein [Campylobacterota bacterium]